MCLISILPPGHVVTAETGRALRNGLEVNTDGAGFGIATDGYVVRGRSLDGEALLREFTIARDVWHDGPAVFHSRLATARKAEVEHLHPFWVGGDPNTLLFHNGTLPFEKDLIARGETRSDSRVLAEDVLPGYLDADQSLIEKAIGPYNKAAVLSANPAHEPLTVYNRGQWLVTPEGVLHSNPDYLGNGGGWREVSDDEGRLYRWNAWQPGQCKVCHLYGCESWLSGAYFPAGDGAPVSAAAAREAAARLASPHCTPAPTALPRFRCETDRIAGLR